MLTTKKRNDKTKYCLLPPLDADTYAGLRANISINGVQVPVVKDEDGYILDGFARSKIAKEFGYDCPSVVVTGLTDQEKRSQVRALNLARRHLDSYAKRQVIADELKENPGRSNNWTAKSLGVDDKTVASVRREMQSSSEIPKLGFTLGSDGKYRPATRESSQVNGNGKHAVTEEWDHLRSDDEESILQAAADIRQRRVAAKLKRNQENRRQSRPVRIKRGGPVLHGDCLELIPTLRNESVSLVVTSPPYADQRDGHYEGISEEDYPDFTVEWMTALAPKMTADGSVFVVIRSHLRGGVLSDYVLRTRLALREVGWQECEELIWLKADAPPLGSLKRPRRTWASILWFSKSPKPYADVKACGKESHRVGFEGSFRFGVGGDSPISNGQSAGCAKGIARISDVIVANVGGNEQGIEHPAIFPLLLAEQLIRTFSQSGDLVLDCSCGSGQTLLAAKGCGRRFLGIDREAKYVKIALYRLRQGRVRLPAKPPSPRPAGRVPAL
jgi:DNA modification methylase/ParB-like chromosome segregation protein Spo0J